MIEIRASRHGRSCLCWQVEPDGRRRQTTAFYCASGNWNAINIGAVILICDSAQIRESPASTSTTYATIDVASSTPSGNVEYA
ncbi:hypothetical protein CAOG_010005 [Capsaspora owczarzaki ATCC 30864]|uniref:Uncharacterized protein n=1 Tax=Capsaspora owczarzaki (strain ATCC 30864) TaxID=595528 RepID=A0A0D2WUD8_CAPO3|nr:hypothetical protein CAOG_010005 [Capsaspora owczarzaki ATCC 30864]